MGSASFSPPASSLVEREAEDRRHDYGEARWIALGAVDGRILTVVYTWRGDVRRLISARVSDRKERKRYEAS